MEMKSLAEVLRRAWVLVLLGALLGLAAGSWWAVDRPTYVATDSLLVQTSDQDQEQLLITQPERYVRTLARVATSGPVLTDAVASLSAGSGVSVGSLRDRLSVLGGDADNIMDFSVRAGSEAAALAQTRATTRAFLASADGSVRLLESGDVARASAVWRPVVLGLGVGTGAGLLLALAWTRSRPRLRSSQDVTAAVFDRARTLPYTVVVGDREQPGPDVERLAYDLLEQCPRGKRVLVCGVRDVPLAHDLTTGLQGVARGAVPDLVAVSRPVREVVPPRSEAPVPSGGDPAEPTSHRLHVGEVAPVLVSPQVNQLAPMAGVVLLVVDLGSTRPADLHAALDRVSAMTAAGPVVVVGASRRS